MLNINENMTNEEKYESISCGIETSYIVLLELENEPLFEMYLRQIDALDLIGDKLYKLYHNCCKEDKKIFFETMRLFRLGVFTTEEIHENLNKDEPIPFIDGSITYDMDTQDKYLNISRQKWEEYVSQVREDYQNRSQSVLKLIKHETQE